MEEISHVGKFWRLQFFFEVNMFLQSEYLKPVLMLISTVYYSFRATILSFYSSFLYFDADCQLRSGWFCVLKSSSLGAFSDDHDHDDLLQSLI